MHHERQGKQLLCSSALKQELAERMAHLVDQRESVPASPEFSWPRLPHLIGIVLGVLWLFVVVALYYGVHKPVEPTLLKALLNQGRGVHPSWIDWTRFLHYVLDVLVMSWLTLVATTLGRWSGRRLVGLYPDSALALAICTGLGFGVLGLGVFALELVNFLLPTLAIGILIAIPVVLWRELRWVLEQIRSVWRAIRTPAAQSGRLERFLWVFILATFFLAMLAAFRPVTAWDALSYHLVGPQLYLQHGGLSAVLGDPQKLGNPQLYFPQLTEMLFLLYMLLRGTDGVALVQTSFGLLIALTLYSLAAHTWNRRTALLSVAIFLAMPSFVEQLRIPYIDSALAAMEVLALTAVYQWMRQSLEDRNPSWLILAGIFSGFAFGMKYTGILVPILCAALIGMYLFVLSRRAAKPSFLLASLVHSLAFFLGPALLLALPWILKNIIFVQNPLYPFSTPFFSLGPDWDAVRSGWFSGHSWPSGPLLPALGRLVLLPWEVTIQGTANTAEFDATIGPLLLMTLPFLVLTLPWGGRRATSPSQVQRPARMPLLVRTTLGFAGLYWLAWIVALTRSDLSQQTRMIFPALVVLALPAAYALEQTERLTLPEFSLHRFSSMVVTGVFILSLLGQGLEVASGGISTDQGSLAYLAGMQSDADYLHGQLSPLFAAFEQINSLPPTAHILFLWEPRYLYAQRSIYPDTLLDTFAYYYRQHPSTPAFLKWAHQEGFTHILLYAQGEQFVLRNDNKHIYTPQLRAGLQALFTGPFHEIYRDNTPLQSSERGWYRLYTIDYSLLSTPSSTLGQGFQRDTILYAKRSNSALPYVREG